MPMKFSDLKLKAVEGLNGLGWNDKMIAHVIGVSEITVGIWRRRGGIAPIITHNCIDHDRAVGMHKSGSSDGEIAREMGVDQSAVTRWRHRSGLERNFEPLAISSDQKSAARQLLKRGATAASVAREVECSRTTILRLRKGMTYSGLRRTGITNLTIQRQVRKDKSILPRIEKAVGPNVPAHIREDAVAEMYADVFSGRLAEKLIEKHAPSYRSRAYDLCGSKYGAISMDAEDEHGMSLAERIADPAYNDNW